MTLPVTPPDRALYQAHLVTDKERRRAPHPVAPFATDSGERDLDEAPTLDSMAPVTVESGTGAALADLNPIDAVPLSVAIGHYSDEG
jgi:hypothetical protein